MATTDKRKCVVFRIFYLLFVFHIKHVFGSIVSSEAGSMGGVVVPFQNGNVHQFKGIPYAKPPVGPLRFSKPVKQPPWGDTLNATEYKPGCIQSDSGNLPISEDCLFLNVYVPNEVSTTANKSVMVWIHGGGYTSGAGSLYDGSFLALHGDVIVVTLNYRLGVLGFFSTGDANARGNYGLWDQIEALKWVKSNIRNFGGNPDSVTLFGESAGAFSVSHLAIIPSNKGLFNRIIMQSGSLSSFGSVIRYPADAASNFGNLLQCSDSDNSELLITCLREIDVSNLHQASEMAYSYPSIGKYRWLELPFSPVIDGELIPSDPISQMQNRSSEQFKFYQSLDVISGCTSAEGSLLIVFMYYFPLISLPSVDTSNGIPSWVPKLFIEPLIELFYNNDSRVLQHVNNRYTSSDTAEQGRLLINLMGDTHFYTPMLESLLTHDRDDNSNGRTYEYYFSKSSPVDSFVGALPAWFDGAGHAAEIAYIFYGDQLQPSDADLGTKMMSYWINFAKYGNPNIGLPVPYWPEFDEVNREYINLDTNITTGSELLLERTHFWTDEVPRILSEREITINTAMGSIKGIQQMVNGKAIHQFRNIHYAEPPVGLLRFKKPVPASKWTGTLDATKFGPSCIETRYPGSDSNYPNKNMSEDCLLVNIYVPNEVEMKANKSVMVWIHGGGFQEGAGMTYDATPLALHGDVIVVTVNYRLGVFGFFSTGDSSAKGNFGLWDQIEAIKWVKSNIGSFGGNPDSITIFGESAGGFSISLLSTIPQNRGLFRRAIIQSGPLSGIESVGNVKLVRAHALGTYLNCTDTQTTSTLVSCLRGIDATALQVASSMIYTPSSPDTLLEYTLFPLVDGDLFTTDPMKALKNHSSEQFSFYQSLDIISGCTSAEGSVFLLMTMLFPYIGLPAVDMNAGLPTWVMEIFAKEVTEFYYGNDTTVLQAIVYTHSSADIGKQSQMLVNLMGDAFYYVPMLENLQLHVKGGNTATNTFQYFFTNPPEIDPVIGPPPSWFEGAGHFTEVKFLFDNWGLLKGEDRLLSADMLSYWCNFAKHGNPNIGLPVPNWPKFDDTMRQYIELDTQITPKSYLLDDRIRFWTNQIPLIMSRQSTTISTGLGQMTGIEETVQNTKLTKFLRIPFAQPPVGSLRFRKPVPVSAWNGVLDATQFGPSCVQTMDPKMDVFLPNNNVSEDCLFLNVYVPHEVRIGANKTVMVWIHGGGYTSGVGMMYDGTPLAIHGDVIVVTINYRLGVLGYLSTEDASAKGNYGLWDQIEALKWIKSNIEYFGGNPNSITVFGESAGALSISHLAMIPLNQGLFNRVIMQSGSLGSVGSISKHPLSYAQALGGQLQCSDINNTTSLVSCLRAVDYNTLHSIAEMIYFAALSFEFTLAPVIDGELIPSDPLSLIQNESSDQFKFFRSLDVISGCNSAEGNIILQTIPYFPDLSLPAVNLTEGIPSWVLEMIAKTITKARFNNDTRILQPIYDKYMSTDAAEQGRQLVNFLGDHEFYVPMLESLLVHTRGENTGANTFQYLFSKVPLVDIANGEMPKWFEGVGHGAEVNFLFDGDGFLKGDDRAVSQQMMSYWSNFAKHGNPNTGLPVPQWPEFDETRRKYLDLDKTITTQSELFGDRMQFWTDKIPRVLSEEVTNIVTQMGAVKGIRQIVKGTSISQFRGIPFAQPPLRFEKPVPISSWTGTLDATRFGPSCIQATFPGWDKGLPNKTISEDCLFLNIYVPNEVRGTTNKSVMVWIHGGGFESGAGMAYDGTMLAIQGDVIVVTINYRLGVFGYLSTGDSSARGNYGLWDQITALKWIKSNIVYFGGNPDSITLFGESAGAFSISHLAVIPENRGLFHRVVMQSGSLSSFGSITKDPLKHASALGSYLQCSDVTTTSSLISCLRGLESSVLQGGADIVYGGLSSVKSNFEYALSPVIDGELISGNPVSLLQSQSSEQFKFYQSLDVISGCNSAEGSVFVMLLQYFPYFSLPAVDLSEGVPTWALKLFAEGVVDIYYNNDTRILQPIYDKYTSTNIEEQGRLLVDFIGDIIFYIPMLESLLTHDRGENVNKKTFQYFFSNQPHVDPVIGVPPKWFKGAGHFAEINFLFPNWGYLNFEDRELSNQMVSYWTNFAKHGNPNTGHSVPHWPEFNINARRYIDLDTKITAGSYLLDDRMRFWTENIPRIRSRQPITISTGLGQMTGIEETVQNTKITKFLRIPFAQPPVGSLRFKKPVPVSQWNGALDATQFGPSCVQTRYPGTKDIFLPNNNVSEDCLFLNVYVPREVRIGANKTVMVWIHGGGYTSGAGMIYDGTPLAIHGDVIVVTINYRLGVFGYMSTEDASAKGNYGLWDQIEALKWIKSNILFFGGNPNSITVFGGSAGALSVSHLAMIPSNQGLFNRVIMQSGWIGTISKHPLSYAQALGGQLQCSDINNTTSLVSCLRAVDYNTLQRTVAMINFAQSSSELALAPVIDGELIPSDPFSLIQNESSDQFKFFRSLDVISGCNSAEGNLILRIPVPYLAPPAVNLTEGIPSWVLEMLAKSTTSAKFNNDTRILQPIYDKYMSADLAEQGRQVINFQGDHTFYVPMLESLLVHTRGGNTGANTFQYLIDKVPSIDIMNTGEMPKWFEGVGHGAETIFLFDGDGFLKGDDRSVSQQMMSYWSNFAKHGNPSTGLPVPQWPEFDETRRQYLHLDKTITTQSELFGDRMQFWTDKIPRVLSEEVINIVTQMGAVKGIRQIVKGTSISQFRGIPFAQPPIGPLRFEKPVPISSWTGTLDATRFGPSCIQATFPGWDKGLPNKTLSEDCLFLNIYVPNEVKATANKSVMVWIHGGGYELGAGMAYDGTSLVHQGDVIVVTINYRLGVFGYLSTGDSSAKGNYGLWDQITALKWIKSNIIYFGGNPDSITLFGESAGAFSISHLAVIPENRGLFHRVIMQSGSLSSLGSINKDTLKYTIALGSYLQCSDVTTSTSLVSCLRGLDSSVLQNAVAIVDPRMASLASNFELAFSPVIDGELILSDPVSLLQNQSSEQFKFYQSLDVISGCNSAEGSLFVILVWYFPYYSLPVINLSEGFPTWALKLFAEGVVDMYYNNDTRILQPIYDKYTSTNIEEQARLLVDFMGDIMFTVPMLDSLLTHDKGENVNKKTFQYFFTNQPDFDIILEVPPKWFKGAGHFAEINFLFHNFGYLNLEDRHQSQQMISYWTNFAKYGDPNAGVSAPYWPEFNAATRQYIELDTTVSARSELLGDRMRFWTEEVPRIMRGTTTERTTTTETTARITTPQRGNDGNDISIAPERCASLTLICICIVLSALGIF